MKKFVSMLLGLCLLFSYAYGEHLGIDFDALTVEELQYIYDEVSARLQKTKEVVVPQGTYVVGTDIPAGAYYVRSNDAEPNGMGSVANIETGETIETVWFVAGLSNEALIHLQDGEQLILLSASADGDKSTFTIRQSSGLFD